MTATPRPLRVAERLKEARERRGLSQRQIADTTKLSPQVIRALEDDRIKLLPSGIYRRSLIRVFAREVGLDPEEALHAFLVEHPDDLPMPGAPPPIAAVTRPLSPWRRALAVFGAVVPLLAGVAYFGLGTSTPAPVERPRPTPVARLLPVSQVAVVGGFVDVSETTPVRPVVMLITVSSRCQLRVIADGGEVLARVVEAGERIQMELGGAIELYSDNAAAIQFSINGQAGEPFGPAGAPLAVRIGRDDYDTFLIAR